MGKLMLVILLLAQYNLYAQTLSFDTKQKYSSGDSKIIPEQFTYFTTLNLSSALAVQASSDLVNGAYSIPIGNIKLQLTAMTTGGVVLPIAGKAPEISLSKQKVDFTSGLSVQALASNILTIKYSCLGGAAFLNVPAGEYKTTLNFTYVALLNPNAPIGTYELVVKVENVGTIQTTSINLELSTEGNFVNGLDILQSNSISNVFSNQPFKVFLKALEPNFTLLSNSIPVNNLQYKYETGASVPLSTSGSLLLPITGTISPALSDRSFSFKTIISALNANFLNKPPGIYSLNYQVYLTDKDNVLIPGASATATGTITIKILNVVSLEFNPVALQANINFSSVADYQQGVTINQDLAMNIFSNNPYILSVRTTTSNLTYNTNTIPVGSIQVKASQEIIIPTVITPEVILSNTAKILIDASSQGLGTFSKKYHLKYFTTPGNTNFINKPAGTYTTTLIYTLTAP